MSNATDIQVLTDHRGQPVAVNEGAMWWMVADVEPTERPRIKTPPPEGTDGFFRLQLTNGRVLIAAHDTNKGRWTITCRESEVA